MNNIYSYVYLQSPQIQYVHMWMCACHCQLCVHVCVCVCACVCMRDKETELGWVVMCWWVVVITGGSSRLHALSDTADTLSLYEAHSTHTARDYHSLKDRSFLLCPDNHFSPLCVFQCPLRSWFGLGTRSQLQVAPWPSSVAPKGTHHQPSFGKKKAAR